MMSFSEHASRSILVMDDPEKSKPTESLAEPPPSSEPIDAASTEAARVTFQLSRNSNRNTSKTAEPLPPPNQIDNARPGSSQADHGGRSESIQVDHSNGSEPSQPDPSPVQIEDYQPESIQTALVDAGEIESESESDLLCQPCDAPPGTQQGVKAEADFCKIDQEVLKAKRLFKHHVMPRIKKHFGVDDLGFAISTERYQINCAMLI